MARSETDFRNRTGRPVSIQKLDALVYNSIFNRIRRLWSIMSPDREYALYLARVEEPTLNSNGEVSKRMSIGYRCAECRDAFSIKEVQVDHMEAIGSRPETLDGISEWIKRVFCSYENLQILCRPCHKIKTKADMKILRQVKKTKKEVGNVPQARRVRKTTKTNTSRGPKLAKRRTKAKKTNMP